MDAVERNGYVLIPHPAYPLNLAPSDFFLFPNLKKDIRGCHFRSDEKVVTAVEEWVSGKDPDFFSSVLILALEHRWSKCITLEDNYLEKEGVDLNGNQLSWLLIDSPSYFNVYLRPDIEYNTIFLRIIILVIKSFIFLLLITMIFIGCGSVSAGAERFNQYRGLMQQ